MSLVPRGPRGRFTDRSLKRSMELIQALMGCEYGMSLPELQQDLNVSADTVRRYVRAAEELYIVERLEGRVRLTNERLRKP